MGGGKRDGKSSETRPRGRGDKAGGTGLSTGGDESRGSVTRAEVPGSGEKAGSLGVKKRPGGGLTEAGEVKGLRRGHRARPQPGCALTQQLGPRPPAASQPRARGGGLHLRRGHGGKLPFARRPPASSPRGLPIGYGPSGLPIGRRLPGLPTGRRLPGLPIGWPLTGHTPSGQRPRAAAILVVASSVMPGGGGGRCGVGG